MPTYYNFESQKKTARNLVVAPNSQLTPNDVFADTSFTQRLRFDGSAELDLTPTRVTDKDMAGKGTEFTAYSKTSNWDSKFSMKTNLLDDWLAAWAFAFCMGIDVVTGTGGPYTHAINWDETTTQAKMTNLYIEDTDDVKAKYPDMAISELTLTFADKAALAMDLAFLGTGRHTDGALASGPPPLPAAPSVLYNADTVLSMGPVGALAAFTGRFLSGTLKLQTEVASHMAPGTGPYGAFMRTGLRKFSLEWVIAAKNTDDVRTLLVNDTLSALTLVTTSGSLPSVLSISIPNFKLKAAPIGLVGDMVVWKCSLDETTAQWTPGTPPVPAISVSVSNSMATSPLVGV